ncbi:hypothetical protein BJY00DRAFT_293994 [Aspergillus carlsbadensis]|nr:hypothetical protein BJY00DRAFT_293994 [Aspergillus carlsbadensis]
MSRQPTPKSKYTSIPTPTPSFPSFPLLPAEIRIQIWEIHLSLSRHEPRIIQLDPGRTGYKTPLPAVNREAQEIAMAWPPHRPQLDEWFRFGLVGSRDGPLVWFYRPNDPSSDVFFCHGNILQFMHQAENLTALAAMAAQGRGQHEVDVNGLIWVRTLLGLELERELRESPPDSSAYLPIIPSVPAHVPVRRVPCGVGVVLVPEFKHVAIAAHEIQRGMDDGVLAGFWLEFRMQVLVVVLGTAESCSRLMGLWFCHGRPVGHWLVKDWEVDADAGVDASSYSQPRPPDGFEDRRKPVVVGASIWDLETCRFTRKWKGCPGLIDGLDVDASARDAAERLSLHSPWFAQTLASEGVSRFEVRYVY